MLKNMLSVYMYIIFCFFYIFCKWIYSNGYMMCREVFSFVIVCVGLYMIIKIIEIVLKFDYF